MKQHEGNGKPSTWGWAEAIRTPNVCDESQFTHSRRVCIMTPEEEVMTLPETILRKREEQALALWKAGKSKAQIAAEMGVKEHTAYCYLNEAVKCGIIPSNPFLPGEDEDEPWVEAEPSKSTMVTEAPKQDVPGDGEERPTFVVTPWPTGNAEPANGSIPFDVDELSYEDFRRYHTTFVDVVDACDCYMQVAKEADTKLTDPAPVLATLMESMLNELGDIIEELLNELDV